jgi:sensor c-di-GMP phosphodiesterase-like protein
MLKSTYYKVVIIFFCVSIYTNAQSNIAVKYKANIKTPLTKKENVQLQEVYGEMLQDYVLNNQQRLKDIKNILRNRVSVVELPNFKKEVTLLSQVPLFNNYNTNLRRKRFNKDTFNPLKYNFDFYSKGIKMYRVDRTNYYIVIKSQFQK